METHVAERLTARQQCPKSNVRFGSNADMCSAKQVVRFAPECDIKCDIWECPLRANSGHDIFRYAE